MGKDKNNKNSLQPKVSEYIREAEKEIAEAGEEVTIEIPSQPEFFKTPVRFGSIPLPSFFEFPLLWQRCSYLVLALEKNWQLPKNG